MGNFTLNPFKNLLKSFIFKHIESIEHIKSQNFIMNFYYELKGLGIL